MIADNKLKQIIVQLGASYEIAGRKLTDDTLLGYAQEIYNTIDIREDEVVPLFRKAREIADIPTMRILTDAYRIICKNRPIKNALPPPESECVSIEEFRNAFKKANELCTGAKKMSRYCSDCAFADFRYNNAPVGSGHSTFLCAKHNKFRNYGNVDCGEWEDRHKEDFGE